MHSSTSSSESRDGLIGLATPDFTSEHHVYYSRWIVGTLVALAAFCLIVEAVTRFGFARISHIASRIQAEHRGALLVRKSDPPSVLLIGNSLPLEDIDLDTLTVRLKGRAQITRFVIESTQYYDWYFGMRRLFAEGVQPDLVILCIGKENAVSAHSLGDQSSYYLFEVRDIPLVRRAENLDLTKTSSLVFAHFSAFYANRMTLRNFFLGRADKPYANLLHSLVDVPAVLPDDDVLQRIATRRFGDLRSVADAHSVRFVYLLPPGFGRGEQPLLQAAAKTGTDMLVPIHTNEFPESMFKDGYHLNEAGARIFTDKLVAELDSYLAAHFQDKAQQ